MMKILPEVKCKICGNVFCCAQCRCRHEEKKHCKEKKIRSITTEIRCAICNQEPFVLMPDISEELLAHISQHFPLHCRKCCKIFTTVRHLLEQTKCCTTNLSCKLESAIEIRTDNKQQIICPNLTYNHQSVAVSTQTSPFLVKPADRHNNTVALAPFAFHQCKTKTVIDVNISESASPSNVSSQKQTLFEPVNLVRTTSTPMQVLLQKLKDSSSCQVSSIYGSSSESDVSPSTKNDTTTFSSSAARPKANLQRNRGRGKIPASATPLRQVMSKSIQRAIAEHGGINYRDNGVQPKKIFDSMNGSSTIGSPLDLRTSPALRRVQSEIVDRSSTYEEFQSRTCSRKQIFSSTKHVITENVSVYEKLETVYETCRSIEASTSCFVNENLSKSEVKKNCLHITPKVASTNLKKAISFETPTSNEQDDDNDDVFYTPSSLPLSSYTHSIGAKTIPSSRPQINKLCSRNMFSSSTDEEILKDNSSNSKKSSKSNGGRLWSLVSSVMRLASFGSDEPEKSVAEKGSTAIVKRCSSFAGSLTRTASTDLCTPQHAKRKRTNTFDSFSLHYPDPYNGSVQPGPSKRIKRIEGRKPIDRMRNVTQF